MFSELIRKQEVIVGLLELKELFLDYIHNKPPFPYLCERRLAYPIVNTPLHNFNQRIRLDFCR